MLLGILFGIVMIFLIARATIETIWGIIQITYGLIMLSIGLVLRGILKILQMFGFFKKPAPRKTLGEILSAQWGKSTDGADGADEDKDKDKDEESPPMSEQTLKLLAAYREDQLRMQKIYSQPGRFEGAFLL